MSMQHDVQGRGEAIARDMNRHSAVVLEGPAALDTQTQHNIKDTNTDSRTSDGQELNKEPVGSVTEETDNIRRQRNRRELEDLEEERMPAVETLEINNPRRYFEKSHQVPHSPRFTCLNCRILH